MDIVAIVAVELVALPFVRIKRHVRYFFSHEEKVKFLKDQLENLKDKKEIVQRRADAATRNGHQIYPDVQMWLTNVDKIREVAVELQKYEEKAKKRCFVGLCPDFMSRYHLSKKAEKKADLVVELLTEANQFLINDIFFSPDPQMIVATSTLRGFEFFKSREVVLQAILDALEDPNIQKIGVYGMGGVGKTMLMKEVAFIAKRDNLFDEVVIAAISNSQKTDIKKAQGEIAEALGLKFEQETESGRAIVLRRRLNNGRKILVILDDIWAKVDLEAAGIIFEKNQNMTNVGCKLLLTSRSSDILHMNVEMTFELTVLSSEESIRLFKKIVGTKVEEPDYKSVAADVVAKCAGLPIAISAVGNALKEKNIDIWKNALQQLKRAIPASIEGMERSSYSAIKSSYQYLQTKPAQSLLLLCSLQPQDRDIFISDLIKYGWGMNLLEDVYTMEEARRKTTALIQLLKGSSLLLSGDVDTVFRMHGIVRDVCISIAAKSCQMFVIEEQRRLERLLNSRKLETCTAISSSYSDIFEVPDVLSCPQLQLFLFFSKGGSLKVPDAFFKETTKMKVLQLTGMEFSTLPSSFLFLTNLRTLCLHSCKFQNIAIIGELTNLEVLSFIESEIQKLPIEITKLSKLKLFDLSKCNIETIPRNLISSLHCLEELYMGDSFDQWDVQNNASLTELKNLSHLTALEIHIPDAAIVPTNLFSENLERYKIFIGEEWNWYGKHGRSRILNLGKCPGNGVEMLLNKTEELCLHDVTGIINVLFGLDGARKFPHLKDLYIENCSDSIQYLFDSFHAIANLESLVLIRLMNLEKIFHEQLRVWSFSGLKVLRVQKCGKLKNLLSFSMAVELCQLQEIEVFDCKNIIEIVHDYREDHTNDAVDSCSLRTLKIKNLPKLIKYSNRMRRRSTVKEDIEEIMDMELGSQAVSLFNHEVTLSFLENLELTQINIPRIWHNEASICSTSLKSLAVTKCNNLYHLFSSSMARCLMQLECLKVIQCQKVIEIIITTDVKETILFPNLDSLELDDLPKLARFSENLVEFPFLRELSIKNCVVLKSFISDTAIIEVETLDRGEAKRNDLKEDGSSNTETLFDENVDLPRLKRLTIIKLDSLRRIWQEQLSPRSFNNLKYFSLSSCDRLLNIFPLKMVERLQRLHSLDITSCGLVEEIFEYEEPNLEKSTVVKFELSSVIELTLQSLPKLKSFSCKIIECPSLRRMKMYSCNQVQLVFCSEECISPGKPQQQESQQSLFWVNKIGLPGLEELSLKRNRNLKQIWERLHPSQCFPRLKFLKLSSVQEPSLLYRSLLSSLSLEKLELSYSPFLQDDRPESVALPMAQIRDLKLSNVDELRCLWDEKLEPFQEVFLKLTTLDVSHCSSLEKLIPFSISFSYLMTLIISHCHGLISPLAYSTVKSLVQLTSMTVSDCRNIQEILAKDEAKDEVIFPQLKCVELNGLSKLEGFCLGNCIFQFPFLDKLIVTNCPKMKVFCHGKIITPKLRSIDLQNEEWHSSFIDTDLNSFILKMYKRQVGFDFFEFPELVDTWKSNCPQITLDFKNCREMKLYNCRSSNLRYLLTPSMALCLHNLKTLRVKNCTMIEQVIMEDTKELKMAKIKLPKLCKLDIKSCSKLRSFCRGNFDFKCPSLTTLEVAACPKLVTFSRVQENETFDEGSNYNKLGKTISEAFFSHKISFPDEENLRLSSVSIGFLWDYQLSAAFSFPKLTTLIIEGCDDLKHLLSPSMARRLQNLSHFEVKECRCMREVIAVEKREEQEIEEKIYFWRLTFLKIKDLQSLITFCFGSCDIEFPSLKKLVIMQCPEFERFISKSGGRELEETESEENQHSSRQPLFNEEVAFPNLDTLIISHTTNLKMAHLWKGQYHPGLVFPSLKSLKLVQYCCQLKELVPSSVSFKNLTTMDVSRCHGLRSLLALSTAKSLMQLERMCITSCDSIEEIIISQAEEVEDYISFTKIKYLRLECLPSLESFCMRKCSIAFPCLEDIIVKECPKLKVFSQGVVSTHILSTVQFIDAEEEGCWEGDLNTTIQKLYENKPQDLDLQVMKELGSRQWRLSDLWVP